MRSRPNRSVRGAVRFCASVVLVAFNAEAQAPPEVEFQFNYRPAAFDALARDIRNVSLVVPEWFFVDSTGTLTGEVEQRVLDLARKTGVPVMAQVKNFDRKAGLFSAGWAHGLVTNRASRERAIARFIDLSRRHRLYGVQIELEGVHISDRDSLSSFIREAAQAMRRNGYRLSVSAIHREEDAPGPNSYTQWMYEHWRGAYDLRALGEAADFVRAVVYAQHTRRTPPGPSQNLPWLERVMKHFTQSIPPQKLVIGLGMGASHWFTVADPKLYYQGARSWSRGIRRAEVQSMLAQYNGPPLQWDDRQKMSFSYIERAGVFEWIVSDNDVRAFDAKLDLARRLGVRGVSMWVNGDEEPGMWSRFRARPLTKSRRAAVQPHGGIPVLAWHYFADSITPETGTLTDTFERFEEMLAWMKRQNFTSVFPEQARLPAPGGSRQVILTFDDGRKEQMRAAAMLERHGFRGIFFVIPSRTRDTSSVYLTRAEIAELARAGHRIAVHGAEHRSQALSGAEAAASVADAYERLRESGTTPSAVEFAFPFGHYTPETARAVASRYRYLMTVNPGYWEQGATMVPRMLIFRDVDIGLYRDYLMGGSAHATTLEPLTADGVTSDTILLRTGGTRLPAGIEMLAVSADSTGRSYVSHPIGDAMTLRGDTLVLDLRRHRDRYFPPQRNVIGFALVTRTRTGFRFLTPGVLQWLRDPGTGPRLAP